MKNRQLAKRVEKSARSGAVKDILKHEGHDLKDAAGNVVGKGLPHFQTDGVRGHTFWGKLKLPLGGITAAKVLDNVVDILSDPLKSDHELGGSCLDEGDCS